MDEQSLNLVEGRREKTRVFISYSRKDGDFTKKLADALKARGYDVFQDIEDILPSEAWRTRIANMLGQSDTIVFVISPDSVTSKVCQWELETIAQLNKRLIPILLRPTEISQVPEQAAQINFIFFDDASQFETAFGRLTAALDTDIGWLREHTSIGELARRWDRQERRASMLLRGKDLKEAESWLPRRPKLAPMVDELQQLFIAKSGKARKRRKQMTLAGALGLATAATLVPVVFYPNQTYVALMSLPHMGQLANAPGDQIPASEATRTRLAATVGVLADSLQKDASEKLRRHDPTFPAWPVAQTSVAIKDLRKLDLPSVGGYFETEMNLGCGCWLEVAEKPPHLGASGWVLFAAGQHEARMPKAALEFFLGLQSPDGWWPLYPSTADARNASTYATSWALLGLAAQQARIADPVLKARVDTAIAAGRGWLERTRVAGRASWLDYPSAIQGNASVGISGLVLHVLHSLEHPADLAALDRLWLASLPIDVLDAEAADLTNTDVTLKSGVPDFDRTRNYRLPWALVATADAYAAGSTVQRARVAAWLRLVLNQKLVTEAVLRQNWVAAELLYALRYVESRLQ